METGDTQIVSVVIEMVRIEECKEKLEKVHKDVSELDKFIDELSSDYKFFIEHRDKIKDVFELIEKEFTEAKSCPVPAVKVDGECKDVSLLLEPVVGRYVPSEDIFYEIRTLIDAGALGKLKDKVKELENYLDSVVGGYTCPIPENASQEDVETPKLIRKKKDEKPEPLLDNLPIDIEADAEAMITEAQYMKLARDSKKILRNETSKRRQWYKECMSEKLQKYKEEHGGKISRPEWREIFKKAAEECKRENPYPKKGG